MQEPRWTRADRCDLLKVGKVTVATVSFSPFAPRGSDKKYAADFLLHGLKLKAGEFYATEEEAKIVAEAAWRRWCAMLDSE